MTVTANKEFIKDGPIDYSIYALTLKAPRKNASENVVC